MTIEELLPALVTEFGTTNVVSVALFGSHATNTAGPLSDLDLIVVAEGLASDVPTREEASPRLKRELMSHSALYAFNIYTPAELESAARKDSWLIETIRVGYEVLFDPNEFLIELLSKRPARSPLSDRFMWYDASCGMRADFVESAGRSMRAAEVLSADHPQLAAFHAMQSLFTQLQGDLYEYGIVATRAPFAELLRMATIALPSDELIRRHLAFAQHDRVWRSGQANEDAHIGAARTLHAAGLPLEALAHVKAALHLIYGQNLALRGYPMASGEVTQMFLKTFGLRLPSLIRELIEASSYKIEQADGRRRPPSFELTAEGEPYYEAYALRPTTYEALMRNGIAIVRALRALSPELVAG
jgi:predicted nucleotidyltransferase